ncbi:hypothetical protein IAD21_04632 [Abditibacteriota bacterium]|nr:hypothetical protein IAD21_04632 [Abditibacteriota bacterium]
MNNREIETLIQQAEKQVGFDSFTSAYFMGVSAAVLTPFLLLVQNPVPVVGIGAFSAVCWFVAVCLWVDGRKLKREFMKNRARVVWKQMEGMDAFDAESSLKQRELLNDIARVYERDPRGEIFPLSQAMRLVPVWEQQQKRLHVINKHVIQMQVARATLLEKQKLLRELGDKNTGLECTLVRLDAEIAHLEQGQNALRASCARLESLIVDVDATVSRRELHREVGEVTMCFSSGNCYEADSLDISDEHLDIKHQLEREIEIYLRLERETEVHLRDL